MRLVVPELDLFHGGSLPHEHARELEVMDQILCANPTIVRWACAVPVVRSIEWTAHAQPGIGNGLQTSVNVGAYVASTGTAESSIYC